MKESYGTLSQTINGLKNEGYLLDFNIKDECLVCHQEPIALNPDDFEIDKIFRFEGESNPDDAALYAISSARHGVKGLLVNGYGISGDDASNAIIAKLQRHHQ